MRAIIAKDVIAIRRSKAIVIPMLAVPALLMIVMPAVIGTASRSSSRSNIQQVLENIPGDFADPILALPADEQLIVLVLGYLLAPLFLIVPLMVSAVLAADAFAGEKERKTLESLLHLPISDAELFYAKLLTAFIPAMVVSWVGFLCFAVVSNTRGVAGAPPGLRADPALVRADPLDGARRWPRSASAVMVRVSARARTSQEANQLGGAVILPLIFLAVGQSSGLLLVPIEIAIARRRRALGRRPRPRSAAAPSASPETSSPPASSPRRSPAATSSELSGAALRPRSSPVGDRRSRSPPGQGARGAFAPHTPPSASGRSPADRVPGSAGGAGGGGSAGAPCLRGAGSAGPDRDRARPQAAPTAPRRSPQATDEELRA